MENRRVQRVAEEIKTEGGDLLLHHVQDPLIGFVTIVDVRVSDDLKHARIYVSRLGEEEDGKRTLQGLQRAKNYLRHLLKDKIRLKTIPELHFFLDSTWEQGKRIDNILNNLNNEKLKNNL